MTEPRLEAAELRATAFLAGLDRLGAADFGGLSIPPDAAEERASARSEALVTADVVGLGPLADTTRVAARESVLRAYTSDMYQPTIFGLNWGRSSGRVADRAAIVLAVEDAALAAVVGDAVDADTLATLRGDYAFVESMHPARAADGRPSGRWARPITIGLLVAAGLAILVYATQYGWLAVAIPVVLIVAIVADVARRPNGPA